jgi:2-succinyl-6-hydroxy-2,4-cyclohexadiene-1-carboxylate synthase
MLHGFTGSPNSFNRLRGGLVAQGAVLEPPLTGHDGSPGNPEVRSFNDEVDRIAALVERAGFAGSELFGYSLGARIALGLLARHRGLFRRATLVGCHPGLSDEAARRERRESDRRWCELLEKQGLEPFVDQWQAQPLFSSQLRLPTSLLAEQRRERLSHHPLGLCQALRCMGLAEMPDFRDALPEIDCRLELFVGSLDEKFLGLEKAMVSRLPRATLHVVEDVGHNVLLERPDALLAALGSSANPHLSEGIPS